MSQASSQSGAPAIDATEARVGDMPAYVAQPAEAVHPPILIVIAEIFGLNDHIRDVVRRFATEGYLAIAPDFFFRIGDPSKETTRSDPDDRHEGPDKEAKRHFDAGAAFAEFGSSAATRSGRRYRLSPGGCMASPCRS